MLIIYGIKNCDSIKKALNWFKQREIAINFHDYRRDGVNADLISTMVNALGLDAVINKRGTTYRQLTPAQKALFNPEQAELNAAIELMVNQPAMIKRPIIFYNNHYIVGFDLDKYARYFSALER